MTLDRLWTRSVFRAFALQGLGLLMAFAAGCQQDETASPSDGASYELASADLHQTLHVGEAADGSLEVAIVITDPCSRQESGVAYPSPNEGDMDIEVDAQGDGYPVDVYFFEPRPSCTISIRLAVGDESFAWVRDSGCQHACPLSDEVMLEQ